MAKNVTAAQAAASWVRGMQGASQKMLDGVNSVTESPAQAAAASADLWQQQVSSQKAKQKYITSLGRVSLEDWKRSMQQKGINRVSAGATEAQPKFAQFMQQWLPHVMSVAARVRQMPKGSLEQNIARMVEQVRGNASFMRS